MIKRKLIPFFVINEKINASIFEPYDVMPYLVECYKDAKKKKKQPQTVEEFEDFIKKNSMYMYWGRCQYEVVLKSWPCGDNEKKIDVHWQIMMNLSIVTEVLMKNVGLLKCLTNQKHKYGKHR